VTALTPGRRAYEAWRGEDLASALAPPWAALGEGDRERWERAGWANDDDGLRAENERLGTALDVVTRRNEELHGDGDGLRVALANLTDRAEASQAITEDEAGEYRKLTAKAGDHD